MPLNFPITSTLPVSHAFQYLNLHTFQQAAAYIRRLPYRRNQDKSNLLSVITEQCGTCSTKHALLCQLSIENEIQSLHLMIGMFRMNSRNTPPVTHTLQNAGLEYLPEAHCYLRYQDEILDFTKSTSMADDFLPDLIEEIAISPGQITTFKVQYHQQFLQRWLDQCEISHSITTLWNIREQCIQDLASELQ